MYLCTVSDGYVFRREEARFYCSPCPVPRVMNNKHCLYLKPKIFRVGYGPFFTCTKYVGLNPTPNMDSDIHQCPDPSTRLMDCRDYLADEGVYIKVPLDSLTKVLSREYLDGGSLERDLNRIKLLKQKLSVVMLDLDGFKRINDQLGHGKGDETLTAFTAFLKSKVQRPHKIVRYGGDEFCIFLFNTSVPRAVALMEEIRAELPGRLAPLLELTLVPTMSVGIVQCPDYAEDPFEIKERADMAQYVSKKNGKDQITIFDDKTNTRYQDLLQKEQGLREKEFNDLVAEIGDLRKTVEQLQASLPAATKPKSRSKKRAPQE